LRRNNPIYEIVREAKRISPDMPFGCLLSIGTGWLSPVSLQNSKALSIIQACVDIAFNAQNVADEFLADDFGTRLWETKKYFRFNVEQGLQDIQLDEYRKMEIIKAMTDGYLARKDTAEKIRECAHSLSDSQTVQLLGQYHSDCGVGLNSYQSSGKILSRAVPQVPEKTMQQ